MVLRMRVNGSEYGILFVLSGGEADTDKPVIIKGTLLISNVVVECAKGYQNGFIAYKLLELES